MADNNYIFPDSDELERIYLEKLKNMKIDTLILGCTHFPLLTDIIRKYYPDLQLISSSGAAAAALKEKLEEKLLLIIQLY